MALERERKQLKFSTSNREKKIKKHREHKIALSEGVQIKFYRIRV